MLSLPKRTRWCDGRSSSDLTIMWKPIPFFRSGCRSPHRRLMGKRATTWDTGGIYHWVHDEESQHWCRGTVDPMDMAILQVTARGSFDTLWRGPVLGLRSGHAGVGDASHLRGVGWAHHFTRLRGGSSLPYADGGGRLQVLIRPCHSAKESRRSR